MFARVGGHPSPPWRVRTQIWLLAVLFFGIGDVVTTSVGLEIAGVTEIGRVTAPLVERYGLSAVLTLKIVVFSGGYVAWRVIPRPHSIGIPLGLTVVGVSVTGWNLHVITLAFLS
jgi:hypothetical protein